MKLINVDNTNKKEFIKFYEERYLNNTIKRNSMSNILKGLLSGKSEICKSLDIEPLMIKKDERIIIIYILAFAYRMPDFIQISFFEAIEDNNEALS